MRYSNMRNMTVIAIIAAILSISCNSNGKKDASADTPAKNQTDTSQQLASNRDSVEPYAKLVDWLKIENLRSSGLTGTHIRIWMEYSLSDSGKVILLDQKDSSWTSTAFYYQFNYGKDHNAISINSKREDGHRRSGWGVLLDSLKELGLYELRDYKQIPNYYLCTDGDGISVELKVNNELKTFDFPCYLVYESTLPDVVRLKRILLFI